MSFPQTSRRNLFLPVVLAVVFLGVILAAVLHFTPQTDASLAVTHTAVWQSHVVFESESNIVGRDKAQDDLYVLVTLRVDDHLRVPLFVKDLTASLTTARGETLASSAVEQAELVPLYTTFPAIKALASVPLLRESAVAPGASAEGMVLLHFPITKADWEQRKDATLQVDFYHQPPQSIALPPNVAR